MTKTTKRSIRKAEAARIEERLRLILCENDEYAGDVTLRSAYLSHKARREQSRFDRRIARAARITSKANY